MIVYGSIVNVTVETVGDELAADVAIGATSLTVVDAADFVETGGVLQLGTEVVAYSEMNDETGVILLESALAQIHVAGDEVLAYPPGQNKYADVMIGDEGEAIEARVPQTLWDRISSGTRDPAGSEYVQLEYVDAEYVVRDVLGAAPVIGGEYLNVDTLPPLPGGALINVPPPAIDDLESGNYQGTMFVSGAITTRAVDAVTGIPTGPGQDLSPSGLFSYGPVDVNGDEQRRFEAPSDPLLPHVFRGDAFIDRLTVGTFTALAESSLAENAVMTLLTGITAPTNAPTVSFEWTQIQLTVDGAPFDATNVVGMTRVGTTLWVTQSTGEPLKGASSWLLWAFDLTTGASITGADPWLLAPSFQTYTGGGSITTTDGTDLWLLWWEDGSGASGQGATADWYLTEFDISGGPTVFPAQVGKYLWGESVDGSIRQAGIGWDAAASELVIAQSVNTNADKVRFHRYTIPTGGGTGGLTRNSVSNTTVGFAQNIPTVLVGAFDFGGTRWVVTNRARQIRTFDTAGALTADWWPCAGDQSIRGIWHDGTQFRSLDSAGVVSNYETNANLRWTSSSLDTWYAAFAWRNNAGSFETQRSPLATFAGQKRARLRVKGIEPPVGGTTPADRVRFVLYRGSTPPAAGAMFSQGVLSTAAGVTPQQLITAPDFSTATHDATVNTFPAGLPSSLVAAIGGWMIDAASDGDVGTGTFRDSVREAANEPGGTDVDYGAASGTTDANGDIVVSHSLGVTPTMALATLKSAAGMIRSVARSSTTVTYRIHTTAGAVAASAARDFDWEVRV